MFVLIAGGGMVGGMLARKLAEVKHDVVAIDQDKEVCDKLYSETGVVAIHGSVARIEVLHEADIAKADVVIAATGNDVDNLACAILAKSLGVPRIVVRMRDPAYEKAYQLAGVTSIVRVVDLLINQVLTEVEQPKVRKVTTIGGGAADIYMVVIPEAAQVAGKTVQDIARDSRFPSQCVFIAVNSPKQQQFAIPRGDQTITDGDEVFLISSGEDIKAAADFLTTT